MNAPPKLLIRGGLVSLTKDERLNLQLMLHLSYLTPLLSLVDGGFLTKLQTAQALRHAEVNHTLLLNHIDFPKFGFHG